MIRFTNKYIFIRGRVVPGALIIAPVVFASMAFSATRPNIWNKASPPKNEFFDASQLRSELTIPLSVRTRTLDLPQRQISARLEQSTKDPRIEPIQLTVSDNEDRLLGLAEKVARPQSKLEIANYLKRNYPRSEQIPGTSLRLVSLDKSIFEHLNKEAVVSLFTKKHHEVSLSGSYLRRDAAARADLIRQIEPFLSGAEIRAVQSKITAGQSIRIDKDLLPKFARKRVGKHTVFKGPNCFHAALAFQSDAMAASSLVNVREEPGYHRNMLNYDELWRALQLSFYEVNPIKNPLQYGDMIVFFETSSQPSVAIDFKSLRHAATYLIGGYVFSKGSKSANSPYVVSTLGEEWDTWTRYTKKLGVKVFRRSLKHVTKAPLADPIDWAY